MKKELANKPLIHLVGLSVRTNNKNEMDSQTSKIAKLFEHFWKENIASKIPNRMNPGVIFSVYTEYDSNEHGDYTYFIGEEVNALIDIPNTLQHIQIPAAKYQKFTSDEGAMPKIVIEAWQKIWKMSPSDLGGLRAYQADFEIYDGRAKDPMHSIVDIYIGIQ